MTEHPADDPCRRCRPTASLVEEIAERYRLGRPYGWQDLGGGWTTNLRLDLPGGTRVARIHRQSTTPARLHAVQAARRAVAAAGVPTVLPLPAPGGGSMITVRGLLVELEPYLTWNRRMKTPDLLRQGFTVLGRVHDALRTCRLPSAATTVAFANHLDAGASAELTQAGAERIRTWGEPALTRYADRVVRHIETVARAEAELADDQLVQVVHGDFWDNNVLFGEHGLAAVIDFDFMAQRPRVDDLALTIYFYLLEPGRSLPGAEDRRLVRGFLDCYDAGTRVPLSVQERLAVPLAVARQPAWSVGRWVLELDTEDAREHAAGAAAELPVAAAVLAELPAWQEALTGRPG